MSNPRVEEVSDDAASDPEEMDLDAFDFAKPGQSGLQGAAAQAPNPAAAAASQMSPDMLQQMMQMQGSGQQANQQMPPQAQRERMAREQQQKSKDWQCIYPVYFDATRSREQGRRVRKEDAIANPLAREIVEALAEIGEQNKVALQVVFEPAKCHPKDWANPGRVRVLVKEDGKAKNAKVQNKHHLYKMIGAYLREHPTDEKTPLKLQIRGMPPQKEAAPAPAIPRGFKMGNILPLHSPALSGGGVSDNFLKEMMEEMGGQLPPGMAGGSGAGPQKPKIIRAGKGKK